MYFGRNRLLSIIPVALLPLASSVWASVFYNFEVVAQTGQTDASGSAITNILNESVSLNDYGQVAFAGTNGAGHSIYTVTSTLPPIISTLPPTIISFAVPSFTRTYSNGVQINNMYQVVARDNLSGTNLIRLWNASIPGSFATVARGSVTGGTPTFPVAFDAVYSHPSVSNANTNAAIAQAGDLFTANVTLTASDATSGNVITTPIVRGETAKSNFNKIPLVGGFPARPMIADDGRIALRLNNTITVLNYGLLSSKDLSPGFLKVGRSPGISDDGSIVVFAGDTGTGSGIYAVFDDGTGFGSSQLIVGGHLASPTAELGFDITGSPIFINAFELDSRIAVTRIPLGVAGFAEDSIVISFVGTPNAASRPNPSVPAIPLTFTNQKGLWTVQVDMDAPLSGAAGVNIHVNSPQPVVQIGDTITTPLGTKVVTNLGVYDPLANAATNNVGIVRTQRRGDHRLAFWAAAGTDQMLIRATHLDSDQDGLLDHWEAADGGIDIDRDSAVDLSLSILGASPTKRDLFLEIDWLSDRISGVPTPYRSEPAPAVTQFLAAMFKGAPVLSGARYGYRIDGGALEDIPAEITVHIDAGPSKDLVGANFSVNMPASPSPFLQGGDKITNSPGNAHLDVVYFGIPGSVNVPGIQTRSVSEIKDTFFGTTDKFARELAFHYSLFVDFYQFLGDRNGDGVVSDGEGFNASPFIGSALAATVNTITEVGTPFDVANPLAGHAIIISQGTGLGQVRSIVANNGSQLTVAPNWATQPDASSKFVLVNGSSGLGEVDFRADFSARPGNDHLISLGNFGVTPTPKGNYLGEPFHHKQTLAHELGHTLGLRHGGVDHKTSQSGASPDFKGSYSSLMNYAYQFGKPQPATGLTITDYSQPGDPVFADWENLRMNMFTTAHHIGATYGIDVSGAPVDLTVQEEMTVHDVELEFGPLDLQVPVVTINQPTSGSSISNGQSLVVKLSATDNVGVKGVTVSIDLDGDGAVNELGEMISAVKTSATTYEANFGAVSGPDGTRTIRALATDAADHIGIGDGIINITSGSTPAINGDLDGDHDVDNADYVIFRSTLGKCEGNAAFIATADYDKSGCVTYKDYQIWYGFYKK